MAKKYYVYSTLTAPQIYTTWKPAIEGVQIREVAHEVRIAGGANVATKQLFTPKGVVTAVSEEDYEHLKTNDIFQKHVRENYVIVEASKQDADTVAFKKLKKKDGSAPVTPDDFKEGDVYEGKVIPKKGLD